MSLDSHSLRYFVERWLEKSYRSMSGNDAPYVDEFMFAYVAFNAAYTAAAYVVDGSPQALATFSYQRGGPPTRKFPRYPTESKRASQLVEEVAGREPLQQIMKAMHDEIIQMCELFQHGVLYLNETPHGDPDHAKDDQLIEAITRNDPAALLLMIYKMRCNLFHGAKQLSEIQRVPLSVSAAFIRKVIPILLDSIERRMYQRSASIVRSPNAV